MFKGYKNTIIAIMLACILTMAVGYAILSQQLNVSGTSNIVSNFKVKITNIKSTATGGASDKTAPTFDDATATFSTNLVSPGDTMTYDVTVSNIGNVNAILEKVNMTTSNNSAIEFSYSGITEGEILNAGSSTTLQVIVKYSDSVTSQPGTLSSDLIVTLDYSQNIGGGGSNIDKSEGLNFILLTDGYTLPTQGNFEYSFDGNTINIYDNTDDGVSFDAQYENTYEIKFQVEAPLEYACSDNCTATSSIASGRTSNLTYIGTNDTHALYELTLVEPRSDLDSTLTITMEDGTDFTYNIITDYVIFFCHEALGMCTGETVPPDPDFDF